MWVGGLACTMILSHNADLFIYGLKSRRGARRSSSTMPPFARDKSVFTADESISRSEDMGEDYPAPTAATTTVPKISGGMDDNFVEARLGAVTRVGLTSRDWLCRAAVETKCGQMVDSRERHLLMTKRTGTAHRRHSDFSRVRSSCFGSTQFERGEEPDLDDEMVPFSNLSACTLNETHTGSDGLPRLASNEHGFVPRHMVRLNDDGYRMHVNGVHTCRVLSCD